MLKKLLCTCALILAFICVFTSCADLNIGALNTLENPIHYHEFGEWEIQKAATCTEKGIKERYCSCGEKDTATISMTNHTYGEWTIVKVATCTEKGIKERYCSCGEKDTATISMTNHTYGEWVIVKDATCTEKGTKERYCSCGEKDTATISMTDHTYGEWITVKDATCTEKGKKERLCSCGKKETKTFSKENNNHAQLIRKIEAANFELAYSELYSIYSESINHKAECNCELDLTHLIENMLYGEWKDSNNNYINYTYAYSDYNNTSGSTWYGTNLPTSKISGNTYYFYTVIRDDKLIIGYQDKLTEEKIYNFIITFNESKITVFNKINGKTYDLSMSHGYDKIQKGNAKLAYIYIAKKIFDFKYPGSVKVTSCHVDYETKVVYATIQATNGFGGTNNTDYKLYEINGSYYISKYNHSYSTNIDLSELNQKLQAYLSTSGYTSG